MALGGQAAAQSKDLEVAARTFKFIEGAPSGSATIGIVSDPSVPDSTAQADAIASALAGGKSIGSVTLTPKVIAPDGISGVDLLFVTNGLAASHSTIGAAAKAQKLLTISTDMACVASQHCVMGVQSQPKVQIIVSRSATDATGLVLNQALKMMVEERD